MVALGALAQTVLGTSTLITGLQISPTSPASMSVLMSPGSITQFTALEATPYGSLPADASDQIVKMGINVGTTSLGPMTAPTTSGQTQVWLVQVQFLENDTGLLVLPYYNAANPSQGYSGPGNQGISQYTIRQQRVSYNLKPGIPAASGTQTAPSADPGWSPVATIAISYGQTSIVASNITGHPLAPRIPATLPTIPSLIRTRLTSQLNLYVSPIGSDLYPGTQAQPFQTLQGAWNYIAQNIDTARYSVNVLIADGPYAGVDMSGGTVGNGSVSFIGNVTTPANVTISASQSCCFQAGTGCNIVINGMTLTASGTPSVGSEIGHALFVNGNGQINFNNVRFGACGGFHVYSANGGDINCIGGSYSVFGGAQGHMLTSGSGFIGIQNTSITFINAPAFANVVNADTCGVTAIQGDTFTGSPTGFRYRASANGVIITSGAGVNYIPGSAAGVSIAGGQYV